MKIAIGNDHRGVDAKRRLFELIQQLGHQVEDVGAQAGDAVDYPDIAADVARRISSSQMDRGILICGSGVGMAIMANKFPNVRAAVCRDENTAELCRQHNDVNVLCLSAAEQEQSERIVEIWLTTAFEGGRHARRVEKIAEFEQQNGLR